MGRHPEDRVKAIRTTDYILPERGWKFPPYVKYVPLEPVILVIS
jgi:hypothetical protein